MNESNLNDKMIKFYCSESCRTYSIEAKLTLPVDHILCNKRDMSMSEKGLVL